MILSPKSQELVHFYHNHSITESTHWRGDLPHADCVIEPTANLCLLANNREMLSLIVLLTFGSAVAYLAMQNTAPVTLTFLQYTIFDVPLYYVIIGSIILGVLLAYIIHLLNVISMGVKLHGKNQKISANKKELSAITRENHSLQLKNAELQRDIHPDGVELKSM